MSGSFDADRFMVETLLYFMDFDDSKENITNQLDLVLPELAQGLATIFNKDYAEVNRIYLLASPAIWQFWEISDHPITREERLMKDARRQVKRAIREQFQALRATQRERAKARCS